MLVQIVVYEIIEMHTLFQHDNIHSKVLFHLKYNFDDENHSLNLDEMLENQMVTTMNSLKHYFREKKDNYFR